MRRVVMPVPEFGHEDLSFDDGALHGGALAAPPRPPRALCQRHRRARVPPPFALTPPRLACPFSSPGRIGQACRPAAAAAATAAAAVAAAATAGVGASGLEGWVGGGKGWEGPRLAAWPPTLSA